MKRGEYFPVKVYTISWTFVIDQNIIVNNEKKNSWTKKDLFPQNILVMQYLHSTVKLMQL